MLSLVEYFQFSVLSVLVIYSVYYDVVPMIVANSSAGLFTITLMGMKYNNELKDDTGDNTKASMV